MTPKTTARRTTSTLILATFALVGLLTTGALSSAFAQTTTSTDFLDDLIGGDNGNGETNEETETEETTQSGDQSETNVQSNGIDQDQTAGINNEMGSGEGSEVSSGAESDAESTYKTKYKSSDGSSSSSPIPGTSRSDSTATSDLSNNGTVGQNQELNNAAQVNDNSFGGDESRAAVVGFDFEFEQSVEEEQQLPPVENGGTNGGTNGILDQLL
jgi:hypothetical protein